MKRWDLNLLACSLARQKSVVMNETETVGRKKQIHSSSILMWLVRERDSAEHRLEVKWYVARSLSLSQPLRAPHCI
jgi:hypothetical protein